jgi:hypothetical protein
MNELDLFAAAIAITDPGERAALLGRECVGRPDLRKRIDQFLEAHFKSNPLLDPARGGANRSLGWLGLRDRTTAQRGGDRGYDHRRAVQTAPADR